MAAVEPPHTLVLHSTRHLIKPIQTIDFSWAFAIRELSLGRSRLLIRARASYTPRRALPLIELVIGPADFVNVSAMLRGIKKRVETAHGHSVPADRDETTLFVALGEPRLAEAIMERPVPAHAAGLEGLRVPSGVECVGVLTAKADARDDRPGPEAKGRPDAWRPAKR